MTRSEHGVYRLAGALLAGVALVGSLAALVRERGASCAAAVKVAP
jgi:hypothetical protein